MRTLILVSLLFALGCATTAPSTSTGGTRPLGRSPEIRNVFAELALPGLKAEGIEMGRGEQELVRGAKSLRLEGYMRCVEQKYVDDRLNARLEVNLRWIGPDGAELDKMAAGKSASGADLNAACDTMLRAHGPGITRELVEKTVAVFDDL